jgi:hypothetical protein
MSHLRRLPTRHQPFLLRRRMSRPRRRCQPFLLRRRMSHRRRRRTHHQPFLQRRQMSHRRRRCQPFLLDHRPRRRRTSLLRLHPTRHRPCRPRDLRKHQRPHPRCLRHRHQRRPLLNRPTTRPRAHHQGLRRRGHSRRRTGLPPATVDAWGSFRRRLTVTCPSHTPPPAARGASARTASGLWLMPSEAYWTSATVGEASHFGSVGRRSATSA